MNALREYLKGKKTYILAVVGILGAVAAWATGEVELTGLIAGVWAALQTAFLRAGIANGTAKK